MKHVLKRLTYANVMSSIAVFLVVAGGSALAATQLGKNSVGSKQLQKNAVTAAKIKNGSVTAAKVKQGSLTGSDINASTLGKVPSATNADHATSADSATSATNAVNATNATNFSRYSTTGVKTTALNSVTTLATVGPFTIKGHCEENGAENYAWASIETSQAGSFLDADDEYSHANFEPGVEIQIGEDVDSATPYWYDRYDDDDTGWTAATPNGSMVLKGLSTTGVHVFGGSCAFLVTWMNNA